MRAPALLFLLALVAPALAPAAELRVKGMAIATLVEDAFAGTKAHLNHDEAGASGKRRPRSYFELGPGLGGQRLEFSVPDQEVDLGTAGAVRYQLQDVNLSRFEVAPSPQGFVVTLYFEDRGTEIVARSSGTMVQLGGAVPDIQMNDIRLELAFTTAGRDEEAGLVKAAATFRADIRSVGGVSILGGGRDLLDEATGYKQQLRDGIEQEARRALGGPEVLKALNAVLWQEIRSRVGAQDVKTARFEGSDLVIVYGPAPARRK